MSHIFKIKNSCNTFTKWLLTRTPFQSTSALNLLGGHLHLCCEVPSIPGPPAQHAKPVLQSTFKQAKTNAKSLRRFVENEMHHLPIYSSHNVKVRCFLFLSHSSFFCLVTLFKKNAQTFSFWDLQNKAHVTESVCSVLMPCFRYHLLFVCYARAAAVTSCRVIRSLTPQRLSQP